MFLLIYIGSLVTNTAPKSIFEGTILIWGILDCPFNSIVYYGPEIIYNFILLFKKHSIYGLKIIEI